MGIRVSMSSSLSITATVSKEWKRRMMIIIAVLAGMGGWFFFDGQVAYPLQNQRAAAYAKLKEQFGNGTAEFEKAWLELRNEKGWSAKKPEKIYTEGDIRTQLILAGLCLLGAAGVLSHLLRGIPTTTRLEQNVIFLPDGRRIPLSKVRALTKKRWEKQGIADLAYEREDGSMGRFILDDYKYVGAADILAEVEKVLPAEAIGKAGKISAEPAPKPVVEKYDA